MSRAETCARCAELALMLRATLPYLHKLAADGAIAAPAAPRMLAERITAAVGATPSHPRELLAHYVTGAILRGDGEPVAEMPTERAAAERAALAAVRDHFAGIGGSFSGPETAVYLAVRGALNGAELRAADCAASWRARAAETARGDR